MQNKKEPLFPNLMCNIVIPSLLMMKAQKWLNWSPQLALVISLLFPIFYGLYDFWRKKSCNTLSIIGFISLLITGGVGLLNLPQKWIAIKEAAIPFILGTIIIGSMRTKKPLIKVFLYNDQIIDTEKVSSKLTEFNNHKAFNFLLKKCTWMLATSFYLSAVLNYILAKIFIKSETGTPEFTEELGKMTLWSYPVIVIPCTLVLMIALWKLLYGLKHLTHSEKIEDLFAPHLQEK